MDRRNFVKTLGIAGSSILAGRTLRAEKSSGEKEFLGVLVDTTRCIGCLRCEVAYAKQNGLPDPGLDTSVLDKRRTPTVTQWTVVNRFETEKGNVYVKA